MTVNAQKWITYRFFFCFLVAYGLLAPRWTLGDQVNLKPRDHAGSFVRVKTVVEVAGSLQVETKEKKSLSIPMEVNAELFFDERGLNGEHSPAVRHYWDAKADIVINGETETRKLRSDRQLISLANNDALERRFWSPHGSLTRQELDLLDVAGSAFAPELLLPTQDVATDDSWTASDEITSQLLRLETVTDGKITNTVKEIGDDIIKVEIVGEIEGNADGASTKIEVKGNYHFSRSNKFVSWFALAIREKREISFATPGFDVTARIRSARQHIATSEALPDVLIGQAQRQPGEGELLLDFVAQGDLFQAALDRRWYLVSRQKESTTMRLVEDGDLLTTCKVDRLNRMAAGKQITLTGFQSDVQAALTTNSKEIVSASETVNPQGVRTLRVAARGEVNKTPIQWIYYHLSNDAGQRLSLIFTHESTLESRLEGIDESLTSSIQFLTQEERQARAETNRVE